MALETYYLADDAYAYPSSNASDGGEDNTEANLKTFSDRISSTNFVVKRPNVSQDYFVPTYSSNPVGIRIAAGECSINGYYLRLNEVVFRTTLRSGVSQLEKDKEYSLGIRVYRDGTGNLRGDGKSVTYPNAGQIECRGVVMGAWSERDLESMDPLQYLVVATFTTDDKGNPPVDPSAYVMSPNRFAFIDQTMIFTTEGDTLEDWTIAQINKIVGRLDQLNHYEEGQDTPTSSLVLSSDSLVYKDANQTIDITQMNSRTQVAPSGEQTAIPFPAPNIIINSLSSTYNGTSTLLARADHHHDGRYLVRESTRENNLSTGIMTQKVSTGLYLAGTYSNLTVDGSSTVKSGQEIAGSLKVVSNIGDDSSTGFYVSPTGLNYKDWLSVTSSGVTAKGQLFSGSLNVSGTTTLTGQVTANGGITTKALFATSISSSGSLSASGNATVGGGLTVTGDISGGRVFNAVWNDYADAVPKEEGQEISPGDLICKCPYSSKYEKSTRNHRYMIVGVCSDTYGHLLGGEENKSLEETLETHIPIAVAGNVKAKVVGQVFAGDLIVPSGIPGVGMKGPRSLESIGSIVGKALESKTSSGVERILIQVMLA